MTEVDGTVHPLSSKHSLVHCVSLKRNNSNNSNSNSITMPDTVEVLLDHLAVLMQIATVKSVWKILSESTTLLLHGTVAFKQRSAKALLRQVQCAAPPLIWNPTTQHSSIPTATLWLKESMQRISLILWSRTFTFMM